jgi:hypothetical protein
MLIDSEELAESPHRPALDDGRLSTPGLSKTG